MRNVRGVEGYVRTSQEKDTITVYRAWNGGLDSTMARLFGCSAKVGDVASEERALKRLISRSNVEE